MSSGRVLVVEDEVLIRMLAVDMLLDLGREADEAGTAAEAIELSGIRKLFPGIEAQPVIGIFSRKVSPDYLMQSGDRLEIYRPLLADPKEVRRQKAEEQKARAKEELANLRRH